MSETSLSHSKLRKSQSCIFTPTSPYSNLVQRAGTRNIKLDRLLWKEVRLLQLPETGNRQVPCWYCTSSTQLTIIHSASVQSYGGTEWLLKLQHLHGHVFKIWVSGSPPTLTTKGALQFPWLVSLSPIYDLLAPSTPWVLLPLLTFVIFLFPLLTRCGHSGSLRGNC